MYCEKFNSYLRVIRKITVGINNEVIIFFGWNIIIPSFLIDELNLEWWTLDKSPHSVFSSEWGLAGEKMIFGENEGNYSWYFDF